MTIPEMPPQVLLYPTVRAKFGEIQSQFEKEFPDVEPSEKASLFGYIAIQPSELQFAGDNYFLDSIVEDSSGDSFTLGLSSIQLSDGFSSSSSAHPMIHVGAEFPPVVFDADYLDERLTAYQKANKGFLVDNFNVNFNLIFARRERMQLTSITDLDARGLIIAVHRAQPDFDLIRTLAT